MVHHFGFSSRRPGFKSRHEHPIHVIFHLSSLFRVFPLTSFTFTGGILSHGFLDKPWTYHILSLPEHRLTIRVPTGAERGIWREFRTANGYSTLNRMFVEAVRRFVDPEGEEIQRLYLLCAQNLQYTKRNEDVSYPSKEISQLSSSSYSGPL